MPSTKLHMESIDACYLKEFSAQVIAADENSVTLDQTPVLPTGWGTELGYWEVDPGRGPGFCY